MLCLLNPAMAQDVLDHFPIERRQKVLAAAPAATRRQWMRNEDYAEDSIGRMMEPAIAVFRPETTIAKATEELREMVTRAFITYLWVTDENERLIGVVAMREMLLGRPEQRLEEIMIRNPFRLSPAMTLAEAMKDALTKHFPAYPVCDADGRLVGIVRGQMVFEAQAFELSAQAGSMVGVEKEERLATPWSRSLKFRHPWLQLNLLTAFVAAAVVGIFESTIDRIVVLAVFLPVLAGQSGNTGCQALAVTLRGLTLGELTPGKAKAMVAKEALLGLCNGALVGLTAGIGMFIYATMQKNPSALMLGVIVFLAMIGSCVVSGVSGTLVPLVLKRLGADPATASSIFLTTATDVVSMGTFLGLATALI
jgi:magnesium transporter